MVCMNFMVTAFAAGAIWLLNGSMFSGLTLTQNCTAVAPDQQVLELGMRFILRLQWLYY